MPKKQNNQPPKVVPIFKSVKEEQDFWDKHSVLDFPDQFQEVEMDFSKLKLSTRPITIRLTESMLHDIKIMANKRDVPYQSLIKTILHDKIQQEFKR